MARWLLDCEPHCGHPWRLGLATTDAEREAVFRLRHDVFFRECGYRNGGGPDGRDVDEFDEWCDQILVWDERHERVIGTYRAIRGSEALKRGGLYADVEFDFAPLAPIAADILQGGRSCVAADYRTGPAVQYLTYGMELLLREYGSKYFLGAESFRVETPDELNVIHSYLWQHCRDPDWYVQPRPECRVDSLQIVPVTEADAKRLPSFVRADLRVGFLAASPPTWDPDFGCYDVLMLGRRDRLGRSYQRFLDRIERVVPERAGAAETQA